MDNYELWKQVVEFHAYEVSNFGRVRNISTGHMHKPGGKAHQHVALRKDGKYYYRAVHRLVLTAFKGVPLKGMQGLHNDDDTTNNQLLNLRWGTPKENHADSARNGVRKKRGPVMVPGDVSRVLDLKASGFGVMAVTRYLGLSQPLVSRIMQGERFGVR
jgi:HNH endonuclease/NUMOD4 motif-containing protein